MKKLIRNWIRNGYNLLSGYTTITRDKFLSTIPVNKTVLEIGPFTNPCLRGENVFYFDVLNREELIERAAFESYPIADHNNIPYIHYVSPTGDLSTIRDRFNQVYSAHCIEHQPDLIRHLQDVETLLNTGGKYYLTIPDKRYCFDALLPESDLGLVIQEFKASRKVHSLANVIRYHALNAHNDSLQHWIFRHGQPGGSSGVISQVKYALTQFNESQGSYIDVHAWRFTPRSFGQIISDLNELNYISIKVDRIYPTTFGSNEFYAVLKK